MLTNAEYHARPYMSASKMKTFMKSPKHYRASLDNRKETPAMRFGTIVHSYVLEPENFDDNYAVFEGDRRTKAGKEAWAAIEESGAEPIKEQEYVDVQLMRHAVKDLIPDGESEVSYNAEIEGVMCQCRVDRRCGKLVYDLKTIKDIEGVDRDFYKFKYDVQAVFYEMVLKAVGMPIDDVIFVFVESVPPYDVAVRKIDPSHKFFIEKQIREELQKYKSCVDSDIWDGVEHGDTSIKTANMPAWREAQLEPEMELDGFYD